LCPGHQQTDHPEPDSPEPGDHLTSDTIAPMLIISARETRTMTSPDRVIHYQITHMSMTRVRDEKIHEKTRRKSEKKREKQNIARDAKRSTLFDKNENPYSPETKSRRSQDNV
jgi:hypothetical protein